MDLVNTTGQMAPCLEKGGQISHTAATSASPGKRQTRTPTHAVSPKEVSWSYPLLKTRHSATISIYNSNQISSSLPASHFLLFCALRILTILHFFFAATQVPASSLLSKDELFHILRMELKKPSITFNDILLLALTYEDSMIKFPCHCEASGIHRYGSSDVDKDSDFWFPDDTPYMTPIKIYGDGNCLPRCASVMAYGTEFHHDEMRIRITFELAKNFDMYLQDNFLRKGHDYVIGNLPKVYASYSGMYAGVNLTPATVRSILCQEIEGIVKPASLMGIWQVHAISNVLGCRFLSVYPQYGGHTVRLHLHRWAHPFLEERPKTSPFSVMWTSTLGRQQTSKTWKMNHFVLCIP